MKNTMNVHFDGIGYVNNRGYSKYWGVSQDPNRTGVWRICVNIDGINHTFNYTSELKNSTEEFTAKLAAHLYQFRFKQLPHFVDICVDGTYYCLDSIVNQIYKLHGSASNLVSLEENNTTALEQFEEAVFQIESQIESFGLSDNDKQVINEVFDSLVYDDMTRHGKLVLKKIVDIFQ